MNKLLKSILSFFAMVALIQPGFTQEIEQLNLQQCMDIALKNNITIQRAQNNALIANSNKFQSMMSFLPNLSAGVNYDFTSGTFFDQFAGRQVSDITNTSDPFIRSSVTLFNGLNNVNVLNQRKSEAIAAQNGIEASRIDVKRNVFTAYLNVILDKENIKISDQRIELLAAQLDREVKRESVGVGNMESVYNFRSQLANEKLNNVRLINQLKSDKLRLIQLLRLDVTKDYEIITEDYETEEELMALEPYADVLEQSLNYSPALKQAENNFEASEYAVRTAQAQRYPTVNLFGQLGSRYSSNGARNPTNGDSDPDATLSQQLDWNFYQYANISLTIPIFTRYQTSNNIQVSKIRMENTQLDLQQAQLDVSNNVQQVYLDLVSAQETYKASQENLEALNQSYEFINKRYETGNTDFFTYLESLNNKNRAEIELVNARYSIIFRQRVLDLLKGQ